MGWPLAVANGLGQRRARSVFATLVPLGTGHLLAMAVVLVPFAALTWIVAWQRPLRFGAGALVFAFGLYRLVERRHPRALARVPPSRLVWWSFLTATAHGAGLMLVPITLGLCGGAVGPLSSTVATALTVALLHTATMVVSGVTIAWLVYRWLGLRFVQRAWFDLDAVWAASLMLTGGVACALVLLDRH